MTPIEESKFISEHELSRASELLRQKGIEFNDRNLLLEFISCIQETMADQLQNIRTICVEVESKEAELLKYLLETKKMQESLLAYKDKIDADALATFQKYLDKVNSEATSRIQTALKPGIN